MLANENATLKKIQRVMFATYLPPAYYLGEDGENVLPPKTPGQKSNNVCYGSHGLKDKEFSPKRTPTIEKKNEFLHNFGQNQKISLFV